MTTPRSGPPFDLSTLEGNGDKNGTSTPEAPNETTAAGSDQAQSPEDLSFWPPVRRHIIGIESAGRTIKVTCGMCRNEVSVAGAGRPAMNNDEVRKGCVYPCGHIICEDCDDGMMQHEYETCPVCRLQLNCETCGLRPDRRTAPAVGESLSKVNKIPKTIPEGGFFVPKCVLCFFGNPDSRRNLWMRGEEAMDRSTPVDFGAQASYEPIGGCTCEFCTSHASRG